MSASAFASASAAAVPPLSPWREKCLRRAASTHGVGDAVVAHLSHAGRAPPTPSPPPPPPSSPPSTTHLPAVSPVCFPSRRYRSKPRCSCGSSLRATQAPHRDIAASGGIQRLVQLFASGAGNPAPFPFGLPLLPLPPSSTPLTHCLRAAAAADPRKNCAGALSSLVRHDDACALALQAGHTSPATCDAPPTPRRRPRLRGRGSVPARTATQASRGLQRSHHTTPRHLTPPGSSQAALRRHIALRVQGLRRPAIPASGAGHASPFPSARLFVPNCVRRPSRRTWFQVSLPVPSGCLAFDGDAHPRLPAFTHTSPRLKSSLSEAKKLLLRCWTVTQASATPPPPTPPLLTPLPPPAAAGAARARPRRPHPSPRPPWESSPSSTATAPRRFSTPKPPPAQSTAAADASKDEALASVAICDVCVKLAVAFIQCEDSRAAALQSELPRALLQIIAHVPGSGAGGQESPAAGRAAARAHQLHRQVRGVCGAGFSEWPTPAAGFASKAALQVPFKKQYPSSVTIILRAVTPAAVSELEVPAVVHMLASAEP